MNDIAAVLALPKGAILNKYDDYDSVESSRGQATAHENKAAIRTFTFALEAEKTHARIYGEAIALLGGEKVVASIRGA